MSTNPITFARIARDTGLLGDHEERSYRCWSQEEQELGFSLVQGRVSEGGGTRGREARGGEVET